MLPSSGKLIERQVRIEGKAARRSGAGTRVRIGPADPLGLTKIAIVLFGFNLVLFVAMRLWHITAYSLSTDQIFSLLAVRHNFSSMLAYVVNDIVHPPLFYLLLKLWIMVGGESLLWLKLFPVLASVATLVPFFLLCLELKLRLMEINLALVLTAVNGYLIYFAQDVRMYSLLVLFTICSIWLFIRFLNSDTDRQRHFLFLFLANLFLVYTHYFGWLVVGAQFSFVLSWARRRLVSFSMLVVAVTICFSPWAYAVTRVAMGRGLAPNLSWIERPDRYSLLEYYALLNGQIELRWETYLRLLLFGFPLLLWTWHIMRGQPGENRGQVATFWMLAFFAFIPIAICYFFSTRVLNQSYWHPRFLIIVAVPYMILMAIAVCRLRPNWLRSAAILLIVGWAGVAGFREQTNRNISPSLSVNKVEWESLAHQIIGVESPKNYLVKVYTYSWNAAVPLRFYLDSNKGRQFQVLSASENGHDPISGRTVNISSWDMADEDIVPQEGEHFWVVVGEDKRKQVEETLINGGYRLRKDFEAGTRTNKISAYRVWR